MRDVSLLRRVFCLRVFLFLDETGLLAPQQGEDIVFLLRRGEACLARHGLREYGINDTMRRAGCQVEGSVKGEV